MDIAADSPVHALRAGARRPSFFDDAAHQAEAYLEYEKRERLPGPAGMRRSALASPQRMPAGFLLAEEVKKDGPFARQDQ